MTIIPAQNQTGTATITLTVRGARERSHLLSASPSTRFADHVRQPQNKEAQADAPVALMSRRRISAARLPMAAGRTDIPGATSSVFSIASAQPENEGSSRGDFESGGLDHQLSRPADGESGVTDHQATGQPGRSGRRQCYVCRDANGRGPLRFQWRFDGTPIPGETNPSLVLNNVDVARSGGYSAEVSNADGSVTSAVATLQVNAPPAITQQPQNQSVVQGASASFSVVATGSPPLRIQWQFNGVDIAGQTGPTLQLANVTVANAGGYAAVVSNRPAPSTAQQPLWS